MIDRKQFVISHDEWLWNERTKSLQLKNRFFINYDQELHICANEAKDVVILGDAWQTDKVQDSPQNIIQTLTADSSIDEIIAIEKSWCGRYVLIVGERIFLDAVGLLPVFYSAKTYASSLRLLCLKEGIKPRNPRIKDNSGMNWQPAPLTIYENVRRLLPSQIINFQSGDITPRQLLPSDYSNLDEGVLIDRIIELSDTSLHNMRKTLKGKIHLSITGGHDSRCQMALLEHSGIDYDCYTYTYDGISDGDRDIPSLLCKALNRKHYMPRMLREDKALRKEYDIHSDRLIDDGESYAGHAYDELIDMQTPSIGIKNSIWEIVIDFFELPKTTLNFNDILRQSPRWDNLMIDKNKRRAIEEYISWMKLYPQKNLSCCNHFFYEQRSGSWLPSIAQANDVIDGINFFHLCNCRELISLNNAFSEDDRHTKRFQEKIIAKACSQLSYIDYEKHEYTNKEKRIAQKEAFFTILKTYSLPLTILFYVKKIYYKINRS